MDRFIVKADFICSSTNENLKSNMDRFIGSIQIWKSQKAEHLKSNMDRFIVKFYHHFSI